MVVVNPAPAARLVANPLDCLAAATFVDTCAFTFEPGPSWLEDELRARAEASDRLDYVDFNPTICPRLPICDAMLGETVTFWDSLHITKRYSESLADDIGRELAARGLIPAAPTPDDG